MTMRLRMCHECPHWKPLFDDRNVDETGVCEHDDRPWDTPERLDKEGIYAAATLREQDCLAALQVDDGPVR